MGAVGGVLRKSPSLVSSREPGAGSREPGAGSREPGAGSRESGAGRATRGRRRMSALATPDSNSATSTSGAGSIFA
ncbi:hypothetical protein E3O18_12815 [Cryobacterium sp. TMT2-42-4]|nr:hypothetical protein E3O18_12815 [Cryobacterium sp. TMT2-42-4]